MYYIKPKRTCKRRIVSLAVLTLLFTALLAAIELPLEKVMADTAGTQAKMQAAQSINEAVLEVLEKEEAEYSDFVKLTFSGDTVSSISTDPVKVNTFKAKIAKAVEDSLSGTDKQISIPLGTLLRLRMLTGRGPGIKVRLVLYGEVETRLNSTFISVGINQTRHRVTCTVSARVAVIMPGCTVYETVSTDYLVAETVIVGKIPGSYTNVNGDDSGIVGQIFDYADIE